MFEGIRERRVLSSARYVVSSSPNRHKIEILESNMEFKEFTCNHIIEKSLVKGIF